MDIVEVFTTTPEESVLLNFSPEEISLIFYILGLAVAPRLTINELNVLANGLFEMAQVMFVIGSQRTLINEFFQAQKEKKDAKKAEEEEKTVNELSKELKKLQAKIEHLEKQIGGVKK